MLLLKKKKNSNALDWLELTDIIWYAAATLVALKTGGDEEPKKK